VTAARFELFAPRVAAIDVQLFSRQLYTLLRAGVPILRALSGILEAASNIAFARVVASLKDSLEAGRELSTAMRRHPEVFSPFYVAMVRVGESTGRLADIFLRLFEHLEFDRATRARIQEALRYPMFVMIAMAVALAVINVFVIPAFARVYASLHAELPLMTRILVATSRFTIQWGWLIVAAMVLGVYTLRSKLSDGTAGDFLDCQQGDAGALCPHVRARAQERHPRGDRAVDRRRGCRQRVDRGARRGHAKRRGTRRIAAAHGTCDRGLQPGGAADDRRRRGNR
jgi:type II secretory pathway component PulF